MNLSDAVPAARSCPGVEDWSKFYFGHVPEALVQELAGHLECCPSCSAVLHNLHGGTAALTEELRRCSEIAYGSELACRQTLSRLRTLVPRSPTELPD